MSTGLRMPMRSTTALRAAFTPMPTSLLQRKCACGGAPGLTGECAECANKQLPQSPLIFPGEAPRTKGTVSPMVHEVSRAPRQESDTAMQVFTKPRFGHNFADVRVYANPS